MYLLLSKIRNLLQSFRCAFTPTLPPIPPCDRATNEIGSKLGGVVDFVSRRVVDRHCLQPVISDTIYNVCSGLDDKCYEVNTMLLLRVSSFNELENKNDTFESKAIILRETPFDFIVGRKTIERYNLFDKIPSQLGHEIFSSVETKSSELVERPCDCHDKTDTIKP